MRRRNVIQKIIQKKKVNQVTSQLHLVEGTIQVPGAPYEKTQDSIKCHVVEDEGSSGTKKIQNKKECLLITDQMEDGKIVSSYTVQNHPVLVQNSFNQLQNDELEESQDKEKNNLKGTLVVDLGMVKVITSPKSKHAVAKTGKQGIEVGGNNSQPINTEGSNSDEVANSLAEAFDPSNKSQQDEIAMHITEVISKGGLSPRGPQSTKDKPNKVKASHLPPPRGRGRPAKKSQS